VGRIINAVLLRLLSLTVAAVVLTGSVAAQTAKGKPDPSLVRMWDSRMTLHPAAGPITIENCIAVGRDGHFHLELRSRQEFMDGRATLHIYEGVLNDKSVQILKSLLDADAIRNLPTSKSPKFPLLQQDWLEGFRATISRVRTRRMSVTISSKQKGQKTPIVSSRVGRNRKRHCSRWSSGFAHSRPTARRSGSYPTQNPPCANAHRDGSER
jgi:hypothetical protein